MTEDIGESRFKYRVGVRRGPPSLRLLPAAGGAALTRTAAAHAHARGRVAQARADAALLEAWASGGAGAAALTLQRLRLEGLERAWAGRRLLVLPAGVQLEGPLPAPQARPAPPR